MQRRKLMTRNCRFVIVEQEPLALVNPASRRQVNRFISMLLRHEHKARDQRPYDELGLPPPGQSPLDPDNRRPGEKTFVS